MVTRGIGTLKLQIFLWGLAGFGFFFLHFFLCDHSSILKTNKSEIEDADKLKKIQETVDRTRKSIREDMRGYPYPDGKYNISARNLEDLVIDDNGIPIRSVVLATWRGGSTFYSEIIGSHPGNFYSSEPLVHLNYVQIRGPPLDSVALKHVKAQLNCDFSGPDEYFEIAKKWPWVLNVTKYLLDKCEDGNIACYDRRYLSEMCKLYPFQFMKIIRMRLRVAQDLLADEKLGVRMVMLVRDPRGTMQSRKHCPWCLKSPDCFDPALHCADLASDYEIAKELLKKYPTTFRVIRYEDLARNPYEEVASIFKFYGRHFHPDVMKFLNTHTAEKSYVQYATFRDSKSTAFGWKTKSTFEEIEQIQRTCAAAMKRWGYVPAMNATHVMEFHPLTDYHMTNS